MEALHREKALLGHCASAAARSASIRELLLQNKFTLIKIENNNSYCENIKHTLKSLINKQGGLLLRTTLKHGRLLMEFRVVETVLYTSGT